MSMLFHNVWLKLVYLWENDEFFEDFREHLKSDDPGDVFMRTFMKYIILAGVIAAILLGLHQVKDWILAMIF